MERTSPSLKRSDADHEMYVKQGLKREKAIDFLRERLSLVSRGVSNLSTDVCAIPEFVRRPRITLAISTEIGWPRENYWVKEQCTRRSNGNMTFG